MSLSWISRTTSCNSYCQCSHLPLDQDKRSYMHDDSLDVVSGKYTAEDVAKEVIALSVASGVTSALTALVITEERGEAIIGCMSRSFFFRFNHSKFLTTTASGTTRRPSSPPAAHTTPGGCCIDVLADLHCAGRNRVSDCGDDKLKNRQARLLEGAHRGDRSHNRQEVRAHLAFQRRGQHLISTTESCCSRGASSQQCALGAH